MASGEAEDEPVVDGGLKRSEATISQVGEHGWGEWFLPVRHGFPATLFVKDRGDMRGEMTGGEKTWVWDAHEGEGFGSGLEVFADGRGFERGGEKR